MTTTIKVKGMTCSGCVNHVQKALTKHEGVINADVDLATGTATIEHQDVEVSSLKKLLKMQVTRLFRTKSLKQMINPY